MPRTAHGNLRDLEAALKPLLDQAQPSEIVKVLAMVLNERAHGRSMDEAHHLIAAAIVLQRAAKQMAREEGAP